MARLPDFIIIGAQRCGTTSLYATLGNHPDIGLSNLGERDDIHFFANERRFKRGEEWYERQFESDKPLVGEKSPMYLHHWFAPRRLRRVIRKPKLIVMMRNPIDRAYSNYQKAIAQLFVNCTFEEAIEQEYEIEEPNWRDYWGSDFHLKSFLDRGYYAKYIKRWLQFFKRENFFFVRSEDFYKDYFRVVCDVCAFIGASQPESLPSVHLQNLSYSKMKKQTRQKLEKHFAPKNKELHELIGRDMQWM